jgi:probable HAF family extracellular repeat protein
MHGSIARGMVATLVLVPAMATHGAAQQFDITDLGTLGGSLSYANGIAPGDLIAGEATTFQGVKHPVYWEDGTIVDLGSPPGFIVGESVAINASGQIAVNGEGNPQSYSAFLWEAGAWTPLGVLPGYMESIAEDIDAAGRVVGSSLTLGQPGSGGFIWEDGLLSDLGTLGSSTRAYGIGDGGHVVGRSSIELPGDEPAPRAFLWLDGQMSNLGVLDGEDFSQGIGVNAAGDVVGSSWHLTIPQFFSADQATLWRDGGAEIVDLGLTPGPEVCVGGFPFYTDNIATAINIHGQVVGHAQCVASGGSLAAFFWEDGVMWNLNDLVPAGSGWELLEATGIDDAGRIVGVGIAPGGDLRAFLLTPTEPLAIAPAGGSPPVAGGIRLSAAPNSRRPSGVYWLRLEAGGDAAVEKLLVVR